ncbi:TPA: bacteriocin immunity protein [Streptococcus equi subsp. zooepidemicus]|nr:bacteriocin immunity protein [Streptococcus equi subsp. zooepidemicus]
MSALNWFSGGKARRTEALLLLKELMVLLSEQENKQSLYQIIYHFSNELASGGPSIPLVLSELNVALSAVMVKESLQLTKEETQLLKQLRQLSHIRYGY